MTSLGLLWLGLGLGWMIAEIALARGTRSHVQSAVNRDQGSERMVWTVVGSSLVVALWLGTIRWLPLPMSNTSAQTIAIPLFASGLALRSYAVATLGRLFTTRVAVHRDHTFVQSGPYRWVRHPGYGGLLMAFLGTGIAMGDWLALLALICPIAYAFQLRIDIEEHALTERFGRAYLNYCRQTKRLIPWIY